jgi:phage terminase large subunit-like protein
MTTQRQGRSTAAYRSWVKEVLAKCEPTCIRCGSPVDMTLPRTNPQGASADHEPPLAITGDLTPGLDGSGIAHLQCNRIHGGKLGSQRAIEKKNGNSSTKTGFSKKTLSTPAAPRLSPPEGAKDAGYRLGTPRIHEDGFILPRLETKPPSALGGTHGPQAAEWLKTVYGMELFPWQRYALNRALEYDLENKLVWSAVIITVGRQSGKSWLSRAICLWRLHHGHLFGEVQTVLHVANKRSTAMEVMRPAGLWATEVYGKKSVRWGNELAGIELPTGDRWLIHAANDSAGVGYSVSMVFVDEAWKVSADVVDNSITPTMVAREQPQIFLVSTSGDSRSDLMQGYRQRALDRLDDPEPGSVLLLEWSAPAEADPSLVETWKWGSPEWSDKRQVFLAEQWARIEESAFRRQYCNQWVIRSDHWLLDKWWNGTLDPEALLDESAVWSVAVETDFDGMGHAVAIAAPNAEGLIVIRVTTHRTMAEVDAQLAKIRAEHPSIYVQVTPGYVDRLREKFDALVGQREAVSATQVLQDLFSRQQLRHDGSQVLQEHFANSKISMRQGGWVLTAPMGRGNGIYAARAVLFAVSQAAKAPRSVATIYTSKYRRKLA